MYWDVYRLIQLCASPDNPCIMDCLKKRKAVLGDTHPDTLYSMNNLAVLYESKFKYDLAEPLYKDCLEKRKAVLGDTHLDTLTSINNLAELYRSQGKYDCAEPLYKDCLKKRKSVLGNISFSFPAMPVTSSLSFPLKINGKIHGICAFSPMSKSKKAEGTAYQNATHQVH